MCSKMCPIKLKGSNLMKYLRLRRKYPVSQVVLKRNLRKAKRFMTKSVIRTYACRRRRSHRVRIVQRIRSLLFYPRFRKMNKRRLKKVRQWLNLLIDHYVYSGRIKWYEEEVVDQTTEPQQPVSNTGRAGYNQPDQTLAREDKIFSKAKCQQNRVVSELRRLNATIIDASDINADANSLTGNDTSFLHHQLNPRLTNMEKDFRSTLLLSSNGMQLINESVGKKRRCTIGRKKYSDLDEGNRENRESMVSEELEMEIDTPLASPSPVSDVDPGEKKHLLMRLRRLTGCNSWVTFCPTHQVYQCFCGGYPPEDQQEQRDSTFSNPKVATERVNNFGSQSEASEEDMDQELQEKPKPNINSELDLKSKQKIEIPTNELLEDNQHPDQNPLDLRFPVPIEGFFCLCQWKYFLAAFESHEIFIWAVQIKTDLLMAVTVCNVTPAVNEATEAVNIRYALNHDELPLLAVQLLRRGWQNDKNNRIIEMEGKPGYWHIKPLKDKLSRKARSKISTFLLIEKEGRMSPTCTMPEPKEPMLQYAETESFSNPESEPVSRTVPTMILDEAISFSIFCYQLLLSKEELLPTVNIFEQSQENNVDTDEPAEDIASPLNPAQEETAKVLATLPDKPQIISIEYLPPLRELPAILGDTSSSVHPPPAKISRLSTNETPEELPTSTIATASTSSTNLGDKTNQKEVNIGSKSETVSLLKYPATPKVKSIAVERPIQSNIPAQSLATPGNSNEISRKEMLSSKTVLKLQSNVEVQTPNEFPAGYTRFAPKKMDAAMSTPVCPTRTPREVRRIYPRPNMAVNSQSMIYQTNSMIAPTVSTTKTPSSGEVCSCRSQVTTEETPPLQHQLALKKVVGLSSSQRAGLDRTPPSSVPVFGYICANRLPAFPARKQDSNFIMQIPDVEGILFKSLAQINCFLNNYLSTNSEYKKLLPAEWKFHLNIQNPAVKL